MDDEQLQKRRVAWNRVVVVASLAVMLLESYANSMPAGLRTTYEDSDKGRSFTAGLLLNNKRLYRYTRFGQRAFARLYELVAPHMTVKCRTINRQEKLILFLHVMAHNDRYRDSSEDFHHSPTTVGVVLHEVLDAVCHIYQQVVKPAEANDCEAVKSKGYKYWPAFNKCVGALDGSHIFAHVRGEQAPWRNRKGTLSQNVLAVVDHKMRFTFILAGWEGSAHDGRVLTSARSTHGFSAPEGCYYLADAGYSNTPLTLVPYRGVRYHLREQYLVSMKPQNAKELFNLRHSSTRNVVERAFGVLKKRFRIFETAPPFDMTTQVQLVYAYVALHNILMDFGASVPHVELIEDNTNCRPFDDPVAAAEEDRAVMSSMALRREQIAADMWQRYEEYLMEREALRGGVGDEDDEHEPAV